MRWIGLVLVLGLVLGVAGQPGECRAQGVCVTTRCVTDGECGGCRCARGSPDPLGYCVLR